MPTVTLTQISNGQTGDAAVVDGNFDTLANAVNGNLDNTNLSATAGIVPTKLSNTYRARAYRATAQSITSGVVTKIQFDTESYDSNGNYDNATNYRYTVPVAGFYLVTVEVSMTSLISGQRVIAYIRKNGADAAVNPTTTGGATTNGAQVTDILQLAAGDYLEGYVYQDAGSSKSISATSPETFMSVHLLSV